MSTPFTIVLPVRNGADYIKSAVESVLSQSTPYWRLIILENASQDETPAYLSSLHDPRISVIAATSSLSIEQNWNRIKDLPVEGLATLLGHDDLLHPRFIEQAIQDVSEYPDASLWMSHFDLIDSKGEKIRACYPMPTKESGAAFLRARFASERDSFGTGYVFRFEDYVMTGGIPSFRGLIYADDYLWYSLARKSFLYCSARVGFSYRFHAQSAAHLSGVETELRSSLSFFQRLLADSPADPELSLLLNEKGRLFLEYRERNYWKVKASSTDTNKAPVQRIPKEWTELLRRFPLSFKTLRAFASRLIWREICRYRRGITP